MNEAMAQKAMNNNAVDMIDTQISGNAIVYQHKCFSQAFRVSNVYHDVMAMLSAPLAHGPLLIDDASWAFYDYMLHEMGHGATRMVYKRGRLEIMTVSPKHEEIKTAAARVLEYCAIENDWPIEGYGKVTLRRRDLEIGLEPDECYYIVTPRPESTSGELDLLTNLPPDLAIEIEVTISTLGKISMYEQIGVREIWRWTGERFVVLERDSDGVYQSRDASRLLPGMTMAVLSEFTLLAVKDGQPAALKKLRDRLRIRG